MAPGRRFTRRGLLGALGASAVTGLVGCSEVPVASPVQQVSANNDTPADTGVRIEAEGPRAGATPEIIALGFLNAMASLAPGFAVAREYLTDRARESWDPTAGAAVTDANGQHLTATSSGAVLIAPLVGRIDAVGRYRVVSESVRHDFGMTKVGGQWRIGHPPTGLLVSETTFANYYTAMSRYFLSQDGSTMVAETLRVPLARHTPTSAVSALLAGPSTWLTRQVDTALPAGTTLPTGTVTLGNDNTAEVAFGKQFGALPAAQRRRAALQVAWTLQQFPSVDHLRLTADGEPVVVPDLATNGTIPLDTYLPLAPVNQTDADLVTTRQGRLGHLGADGSRFTPLATRLAAAGADITGRFAATGAGSRLLWAAGEQLLQATATRVSVVARGRFTAPHATASGTAWSVQVDGTHPVLLGVPAKGSLLRIPLAAVPSGTVRAACVAPDGSRVALVVQRGRTGVLGVVAVGRRPLGSGSWVPLSGPETPLLVDVRDVTWTAENTLGVLAAPTVGGSPTVLSVSDDGAETVGLGPVASVRVEQVLAQPSSDGTLDLYALTAGHALLHCDNPWRWHSVATGTTAVALSA